MAREMETNGNLEELGVEEQRVGLRVRIKIPKFDPMKKSLNLKLGGCSGAMGLH